MTHKQQNEKHDTCKNIYLLTDYRNCFYSNVTRERVVYSSIDLSLLRDLFAQHGWRLHIMKISQIDFRNQELKGQYALYQSTEDDGGFYKSFIDDILYGLHLQGVKLIPSYSMFKAHHNKVFMELLRVMSGTPELNTLRSRFFGCYEEFLEDKQIQYPFVLKGAMTLMA